MSGITEGTGWTLGECSMALGILEAAPQPHSGTEIASAIAKVSIDPQPPQLEATAALDAMSHPQDEEAIGAGAQPPLDQVASAGAR